MDVRDGLWRRLRAEELMLLKCGVGEDSWESLGLQGDPTSPFWRRSILGFLWREWCWCWNSNTLDTSCKELTHWKRLWCWEGLGAGGEGDDRGWDGWMASRTRWTWVWVNSRSWWWTGRPGMLRFMGLQRVRHNWATELNWTEHIKAKIQNQISFTTAQKSETFRCKSTNHVQDLNAKNYRMLMKENRHLNKRKDTLCLWIRRLNIVKMITLPILSYRVNTVLFKILIWFF